MRFRSLRCLSAALAACVHLSAAAQAQVIPFSGNFGRGLSPSDNQMVFESVARLNAAEPSKVGQSDSWSNPETKSSGSSSILRVFRSGGMPCHLGRHHIVVPGQPPARDLPPHLVPHAKRGMEDQGLTLRAAAPLYSAAFRATHVTARRG